MTNTPNTALYLVQEVHNFGGFFGGDTVTLTAVQRDTQVEQTLMIDERSFTNVRDRHTIAAGMLLELTLSGERVDHAELLGAASQAELRAALGTPQLAGPLAGPQILSYRCDGCGLWVAGAPETGQCRVCGRPICSSPS
jgi:rubrerythrin